MTPEQLAISGSESAHQRSLFCWCAMNVKKYPELQWMFHIPNGEARTGFAGARLKAEGTRRGVWDIFLPVASARAPGLFLEMKKPGGRLSRHQIEFGKFVKKQGYRAEVCYGWQEAVKVIEEYLSNA